MALAPGTRLGPYEITSRAMRSVPGETGAAAGPPVTVARFENRTGDATLDPIGQMAADAVSQELPNLLETIQREGTGSVPRTSQEREAIPQRARVTGAYYLDGQNLRIQVSLSDTVGTVLHATEPAVAPRSNAGRAVDVVRQRVLGAIVVWADPDVRITTSLARPPLYDAYREYKAGFIVFADNPARAITPQFLNVAANRFSLAQSLYVAEEWTEAAALTSALLKEQPGSVLLHRQMDFETLRGFAPFDDLMKPKG